MAAQLFSSRRRWRAKHAFLAEEPPECLGSTVPASGTVGDDTSTWVPSRIVNGFSAVAALENQILPSRQSHANVGQLHRVREDRGDRFRIALENRGLSAGTINGRLAAVRRLPYAVADAGLLSPELAAGIRRVKGVKRFCVRLGNWFAAGEARRLWQAPDAQTLKGKRDRAILAVLLGCGLRRRELADLDFTHSAMRRTLGNHRSGKGGHIRTVPVPAYMATVHVWTDAAELDTGNVCAELGSAGATA